MHKMNIELNINLIIEFSVKINGLQFYFDK